MAQHSADPSSPAVPRVLVVIGPSGSGKSSVVRALERRGVLRVTPSWTTRPRRPDEMHGSVEHRFVDDARFTELEERGFFLEVVTMFGLPHRYGLPRVEGGQGPGVPAIMARASLMGLVATHFPRRVVYHVEDTEQRARQRLVERGASAREIEGRMGEFTTECRRGRSSAHRVFVNEGPLDDLVGAVERSMREDFAAHVR